MRLSRLADRSASSAMVSLLDFTPSEVPAVALATSRMLVVISPVYMTNMLVRHTGKKLLEKHMARSKGAAYAAYVRRTSGFVPWPPR